MGGVRELAIGPIVAVAWGRLPPRRSSRLASASACRAASGRPGARSSRRGPVMTLTNELLLLIAAIAIGIGATYLIMRRQRMDRDAGSKENLYATSTEGEKRCPYCGMPNM